MERVVDILRLQMRGSKVRDLHQALMFLGLRIAGNEKKSQQFGKSTRKAVQNFQEAHGLEPKGS